MAHINNWRFKFQWRKRFTVPEFTYSVVGAPGGAHLHISDYTSIREEAISPEDKFSGGLEIHSRKPLEHMYNSPPSQDHCWLLKSPCWHDGTSLYVTETVIPMWINREYDFDYWHQFLANWAEQQFEERR